MVNSTSPIQNRHFSTNQLNTTYLIVATLIAAGLVFIPSGGGAPAARALTGSEAQAAKKHIERGDEEIQKGAFKNAIQAYTDAIEIDENSAPAYYRRARVHGHVGQLGKALIDYKRAIDLKPTLTDAYIARAQIFTRIKALDNAIVAYTHAIELDPTSSFAYYHRAQLYRQNEHYNAALHDYNKAIDVKGGPAYAGKNLIIFERAHIYLKLSMTKEAFRDLNKGITNNSTNAIAYNHRAWAYYTVGKLRAGLKDVNKSLSINFNSANAFDTRGHIYKKLGKRVKAIADFRQALRINPSLIESRRALREMGVTVE